MNLAAGVVQWENDFHKFTSEQIRSIGAIYGDLKRNEKKKKIHRPNEKTYGKHFRHVWHTLSLNELQFQKIVSQIIDGLEHDFFDLVSI